MWRGSSRVSDAGEPVAADAGCRGRAALASKGAGGAQCELSAAQLRGTEALLEVGPAVRGWADQCWTLARIAELVRRRFGWTAPWPGWICCCTGSAGACRCQPGRAAERDEAAITAWREETWPVIKSTAADLG